MNVSLWFLGLVACVNFCCRNYKMLIKQHIWVYVRLLLRFLSVCGGLVLLSM